MHIPDGFIDTTTAAATGAVSLGALAYAVRRTDRDLGERTVPLLGVTGAFVFAAQMPNFPLAAGTSGHREIEHLRGKDKGPGYSQEGDGAFTQVPVGPANSVGQSAQGNRTGGCGGGCGYESLLSVPGGG